MTKLVIGLLATALTGLFVLSLGLWGRYGAAIAWDSFVAYCL
jgi:hypothetical protein